ncbi:hypothetical protein SKAU_G00418110 [Synaphobranchus kaupii]|uniref:Ig-like domain-containing protein n=1 Tax=Synaphobranchus kaupii TaxID=118154 RepID=A0A9Q1E619_SYNKA|nr:hypothetical protein SKAU_G00418110 [Synaphobranchus kaupii]
MLGLVERLPDIHEGAGKWIRALEEETMGKLLAVGDLKALLARLLGMARMEEVLMKSGLQAAVNTPYLDGASFDQFRPAMWRTLREDYPTKIDPKSLKGEEVGDTVNPANYLHRQLKRWKLETGRNPEGDELMTTLFRTSIVEAMPPPVRSRLEDVVGLNSKTHREFCDHVIHAVEKYRKEEQKLKDQEKETQRKLTQLQLGELTKKQCDITEGSSVNLTCRSNANPPVDRYAWHQIAGARSWSKGPMQNISFPSIQALHGGQYYCTMWNPLEQEISTTVY